MNNRNLLEGTIVTNLIQLALPIIGTSFIQMAYNMTDMIWIGRVGSSAVAAVGTSGFYPWLGMALILISKIGVEVGVSQSIGRKDIKEAEKFAENAVQLNIIMSVLFTCFLLLFRHPLIAFFGLGQKEQIMAVSYLSIVSLGIPFYFINPIYTGIFNGTGKSIMPFIINTIGLVVNMIMDPVLILGFGSIPAMGVKGAAIATVSAQCIVTFVFIGYIKKRGAFELNIFQKPSSTHIKKIIDMGLPAGIQSGLFTIFAMIIGRMVASWGPVAIAVQKVGSQIEAISWMTAGGFSTAISSFVGQNYGAKKWERIKKGYTAALGMSVFVGIGATVLLLFCAEPIFRVFIPEKEAIEQGVVYLHILALSQLFMCAEITTGGAFNGIGKPKPPAVIAVVLNALRIPMAYTLSSIATLGISGIWWSITLTTMIKGMLLVALFFAVQYKIKPAIVHETV